MIELFYSESIHFKNWDLVEDGRYLGVYNFDWMNSTEYRFWQYVEDYRPYKYEFNGVKSVKMLEIH